MLNNTIVLLTTNGRKAEEWRNFLRNHNYKLVVLPPEENISSQALVLTKDHPIVCWDQSRLVLPKSETDAPLQHLQLVDHFCEIQCWKETSFIKFSARRSGYLDCSLPIEANGWWDTQFRDAYTGLSYSEQSLARKTKLSARTAALEQLVAYLFPGPRKRQYLQNNTSESFSEFVNKNAYFNLIKDTPSGNLVQAALNRGLFFGTGFTRPQQVYFWPGISGLPSVPRENDIDEAKFLYHDLIHFLIGRLPPTGSFTELERQVFLMWAMIEEAVALFLADGVFVDQLRNKGVEYDFTKHKGYAFYQSLGLAGSNLDWNELVELLWANTLFFVMGDRSGFKNCDNKDALRYFEGFERFSMGDWLWNERMSLYAIASASFYNKWWNLVRPLAKSLNFLTATDVVNSLSGNGTLLRQVFDVLIQRLQAWFKPETIVDPIETSRRSHKRWLIGQLGFFAAFDHIPAVQRAGQLLACDTTQTTAPAFIRQTMETVKNLGECSNADVENWSLSYPLFPPYYIGYKDRPGLTTRLVAERILFSSPLPLSEKLMGVCAIITTPARDRFLISQDKLIGGLRENEHEIAEVAWRRIVTNMFGKEGELLANKACRWRTMHEDILLVELPETGFKMLNDTRIIKTSEIIQLTKKDQTIMQAFIHSY